ncbi:M16 family metallopeptidase [Virgibacillus halophilus]|uniref:M16 family metallopeptidase n=1 Tax=Tigheibacillus halophilus TaxID=361280 RepID=UPI003635F759
MVERHQCKNGVRVVLEPIKSVRSVTIGIWVLTGSINENERNNGISHFLEHMFFKGTKTRSPQDIAEAFDSIGGQVNAFTSKEYTCFYARVLDTHKEYALEILSDMFFNSTFDEAEMEREKKVVSEEIKMYEDTPDDIVHDLLARASYGQHALGYPILGTDEHLQTFNPDTLHAYVHNNYKPENIVVSVAGNVPAAFINDIDNYFGSYQYEGERHIVEKPAFIADRISRVKETEQAHLCLGYPGLAVDADNMYSLIIANNVLGGSMSSRLFQDVREKQGLAYSVFSYHSSFLNSGLLTIYAGTGKNQLSKLRTTVADTIASLAENGLTDKELKNSKEQLKGGMMLSMESTNSHMSRNAKNELLLNKHQTLDDMIAEIDAVTHESIKNVLAEVFSSEYSEALIAPDNQ